MKKIVADNLLGNCMFQKMFFEKQGHLVFHQNFESKRSNLINETCETRNLGLLCGCEWSFLQYKPCVRGGKTCGLISPN